MKTQAQLFRDLKAAATAESRRDLALALLDRTQSRQYLDECLRVLSTAAVKAALDGSHRTVLREKAFSYYADAGKRDKAGILREGITRLLVAINHPDDLDLYQLGVETYHLQPVDDVAQNLRAVSLAGMAPIDPDLACLYATRFLAEEHTSVFNCEPALMAVKVLAAEERRLPIYHFLLHGGEMMANSGRGELTGAALESLGDDFPPRLYADLMQRYMALDQPTASIGIVNWVIQRRAESLYEKLERLIIETRDIDLRRYGLVMMAAARDADLSARLLQLARLSRLDDAPLFIEALDICDHPERDATLALLRKRVTPASRP